MDRYKMVNGEVVDANANGGLGGVIGKVYDARWRERGYIALRLVGDEVSVVSFDHRSAASAKTAIVLDAQTRAAEGIQSAIAATLGIDSVPTKDAPSITSIRGRVVGSDGVARNVTISHYAPSSVLVYVDRYVDFDANTTTDRVQYTMARGAIGHRSYLACTEQLGENPAVRSLVHA